MIKSVKISRNDDLIFCEVDDENIDENFSKSKEKIYKLFKDAKLEKNYGEFNDLEYTIHYLIDENIVYSIITHKKYLPKLALSFLVNLNMNFIEWLKNKLPYVFFKLGEINENSYFTDFEINIKKMKNKYKVIKMNENDNTTINKEIYDIYKKTIHNMDVFYERNKKDNSIKYNNENCGKAKTYTREKIRIDKRIIFIEISVIIFLKILFELF